MNYPKVTAIVLSYNGLTDTRKCLLSLLKTKYEALSIVVLDNGSARNESKLLKKEFKSRRVTFVRSDKNLGYTGGNNLILSQITTPYIAFVNNDVVVTPNWLSPLISYMQLHKKVAVAQPKILWLKRKSHFDYAGACGGYLDTHGYPFTRGRIFTTLEKDRGQYDAIRDVFWASGAAMVVRRSVFKRVGFFDTRFFNYMEEIDLCFRINKAGKRIVCVPEATVYHKGASTSSKNELKKRFWEHRNNLLMITKNFPLRRLSYILPVRFLLEYVSIFYYLSHKRVDYAAAVILSQLSFFSIAPGILIERLSNKEKQEYNSQGKMLKKKYYIQLLFP